MLERKSILLEVGFGARLPISGFAVTDPYGYDPQTVEIAKGAKLSVCVEAEITDTGRVYLEHLTLSVEVGRRGHAGLGPRGQDSQSKAGHFIPTLDLHQRLTVVYPKPFASRQRQASAHQLENLTAAQVKNGYGHPPKRILHETLY